MPSTQLSQSDLELLRQFDTPTVCNVIELFGVRPQTEGYMDKRIGACYPEMAPVVGYASTATFRSSTKPSGADAYSTLDAQVALFTDLPQPVIVVFQDLDDAPVAATFGEVMTTTYKAFGAAALITSGAARDLEQVRALGFPCFADGAICSHGYPRILDLHVPVHVGGLVVRPGDLLHGDANGVTNIPHEIAHDVANACAEFCQAEDAVLDYCRAGEVTPVGLGEARKEQERRVKAIKQRLGL